MANILIAGATGYIGSKLLRNVIMPATPFDVEQEYRTFSEAECQETWKLFHWIAPH